MLNKLQREDMRNKAKAELIPKNFAGRMLAAMLVDALDSLDVAAEIITRLARIEYKGGDAFVSRIIREARGLCARRGVLTRDVTRAECDWLAHDWFVGASVYEYTGPTYGCISPGGVAVTDQPDQTPFFEVPTDAVRWV